MFLRQAETIAHLALFPVLTHLALWAAEMLIAALARCGGLRALIYVNRRPDLLPPHLDDLRYVSLLATERWDEWEVGMRIRSQKSTPLMVGVRAAEYEYRCATRSRTAEGRQKSVPGKERRSARARSTVAEKRETGGRRRWVRGPR
jgi:hypothetical protein